MSKSKCIFTFVLGLCVVTHIAIVSSVVFRGEGSLRPVFYDSFRQGPGMDFYSLYHAGTNISRNISPYDREPDSTTPFFYPYRYAPSLAYAAQALTFVNPIAAYMGWILILEALLFYFLFLLYRNIPNQNRFTFASAALLLSSPFFLEVYMGQFTFFVTTLCIIAVIQKPTWIRGLLLALTLFIKPVTLITLPAFWREDKGKKIILIATMGLAVSVPFFFFHRDQWKEFFALNMNPNPRASLGAGNYGMVEFLYLLINQLQLQSILEIWPWFVQLFRWALILGTLMFTLFSNASLMLRVVVLLLAHFLTYSHVWEHHMSAVCVMAAALLTIKDLPEKFYRTVSICLIMLALPTPFYIFYKLYPPDYNHLFLGWPLFALYLIVLPKVIPTFLLYVLNISYLRSFKPSEL